MIAKMKKLTLLCPVSAIEQTVRELQHVGVVHLIHVRPPEGEILDSSRRELAAMRELFEKIPWDSGSPPSGLEGKAVTEEIRRLQEATAKLTETLGELKEQYQTWMPFGPYNPDSVRKLKTEGCTVRFFELPLKSSVEEPEGAVLVEVNSSRQARFVALFSMDGATLEGARELIPPEASLTELGERIVATEASLESNKRSLQRFAGDRELIREMSAKVECREAELGMGTEATIAYLCGYFPSERKSAIIEAASRHGWGYTIGDPEAGDEPPTLIENPGWVRPIEPVFDLIGVTPGYRESDISIPFLVFFSLFYAMLVGDAGYGFIFLVLTVLARMRFPNLPRQLFPLLFVTSGATILWGVLNGNYFSAQQLPSFIQHLQLSWLTGDNGDDNLMLLCFLIGSVHLTLAHVWNFLRTINSWQAIAQIGWICSTWAMFFAARTLVLGYPFPEAIGYLLGVGLALIIPFMTPLKCLKKEWSGHLLLPLKLVSNFVDVVSYIRLFAVGTATYAVASAFNQIALSNGVDSLTSAIGAVIVLLMGHTLNLLLAAMAVLVHGIRLNTLEFASHMDLQWSGIRYLPFTR
jgi:V/A-type H+/Na+-transporting ATPase subunit I